MKRFLVVLVVMAMVFSAGFVFAEIKEEEIQASPVSASVEKAEVGKREGWQFAGEVSMGIHSKYVDPYSGELWYSRPVSTQSATIGVEKGETGFYIQAENFSPFRKKESKETDFYLGFYTEAKGIKFDAGIARYQVREKGEIDYSAVYGEVEFPEVGLGIIPFLNAEYRFADKKLQWEDEDGNVFSTSMSGFVYYGGFKREFKVAKMVSLNAEVGAGGNTGIYEGQAENLAYVREKVEVSIEMIKNLNLKIAGMTQQNLGRKQGIASRTDKPFFGLSLSWNF